MNITISNISDYVSYDNQYIPTWVDRVKFDSIWTFNQLLDDFKIDKWGREPFGGWFTSHHPYILSVAIVSFNLNDPDQNIVQFREGQHRTRWQIECGGKFIVIGLQKKDFKVAQSLGLSPKLV